MTFMILLLVFLSNSVDSLNEKANRNVSDETINNTIPNAAGTVSGKHFNNGKTGNFNQTTLKTIPGPIENVKNTSLTFSSRLIEIERGQPPYNKNGFTSLFHTIPLYADVPKKIYHLVADIPQCSPNATMGYNGMEAYRENKFLVDTNTTDIEKKYGFLLNYGAFPQTWSDHRRTCPHTRHKGNGEPMYALEIGKRILKRGELIRVKVLGAMGAFINKKIHWKIIVVNINDPIAPLVNDINDVVRCSGKRLKDAFEWLEHYNVTDFKRKNKLALYSELKDKAFAQELIADAYFHWHENKLGKVPKRSYIRRTTTTSRGGLVSGETSLEK